MSTGINPIKTFIRIRNITNIESIVHCNNNQLDNMPDKIKRTIKTISKVLKSEADKIQLFDSS